MVWVLLGLGGAAGAVARFAMATWVYRRTGTAFPWGTLVVNVIGAFLLGVVITGLAGSRLELQLGALVATGFLGDFTTFSTFAFESVMLTRDGERGRAVIYVLASTLLAILACAAGMGIGAWLV